MIRSRRLFMLAALVGLSSTALAQAPVPATLTLERIIGSGEFFARGFGPVQWRENGPSYQLLERSATGKGQDLVRYDVETGRREVVVSAQRLIPPGSDRPLGIADYELSADGSTMLIFTNTRRVWRRNSRGDYWTLDLPSGLLRKLGGGAPEASLMYAKLAPDAKSVAYVLENDLYVERLVDGTIFRLTTDGTKIRSNGRFDWVYEEEFMLQDGFRWSPNSQSIAYWQIDDSGVGEYVLLNTTDAIEPKLTHIPYPKVGKTNPLARVGVVPATGGPTKWVELPGSARDHYIARMDWADHSDELVLQRLNRLQNTDEVILADVASGKIRTVLAERDDAWVDVVESLGWFDSGKKFTWLSERDGWRHLYGVDRDDGKATLITPGDFDVMDVARVDETGGTIDFFASPGDATRRYLFRATLDRSAPIRRLTPLDQVGTHDYNIAPDGHWAIHTFSSFDRPPVVELVTLPDHKVVRTLVDNHELRAKLDAVKLPPAEFFKIEIEPGLALDGWCLKPPNFDPSKRYPLLLHVYGEPAGQTVVDHWGGRNDLWHRMLAQKGYIVASIDNRGTSAARGRAWRKSIYRQVGILASSDQAKALRALETRWPFIDPGRVGIWGWSGGGSMSLNAIFRYPELYQTAIAVAFVSDQRLYDTIYQERYMGLPDDNAAGYRDGSPITFAAGLKGNLLLIHGTGDDNCHFQSCERLVNALIGLNKPFSMMAYPNRTHSIAEGANTSLHLYGLMTRFLEQDLPAGPR